MDKLTLVFSYTNGLLDFEIKKKIYLKEYSRQYSWIYKTYQYNCLLHREPNLKTGRISRNN